MQRSDAREKTRSGRHWAPAVYKFEVLSRILEVHLRMCMGEIHTFAAEYGHLNDEAVRKRATFPTGKHWKTLSSRDT
jgi:hypothetical protein